MDPLKIKAKNSKIYQPKVWGNTEEISKVLNIDSSKFKTDKRPIGEAFLISSHKDGESEFKNGKRIKDLQKQKNSYKIFGHRYTDNFPILLKLLSAKTKLSIQNHYSNKVEAWITQSAGKMIMGLTQEGEKLVADKLTQEVIKGVLYKSSSLEELEKYFNIIDFKPGEIYIIQAGVVHALLFGTLLEPQKNCNLTNRGGDWARNDPKRPLQLKEFFEALYKCAFTPKKILPVLKQSSGKTKTYVCLATKDFAVEEIRLVDKPFKLKTDGTKFYGITSLDSTIKVNKTSLKPGESALLPAEKNIYTIKGKGKAYLIYSPNLKKDIIDPLINSNAQYKNISQLGGNIPELNDIYIELKELGLI